MKNAKSAQLSELFRSRLLNARFEGVRQYRLATNADTDPTTLSRIVHGAIKIQRGDERVVKVGEQLGLSPEQCFELESSGVAVGSSIDILLPADDGLVGGEDVL